MKNEELTIRKTLYPIKYRRKVTDPEQLSFNEILYADDTILLQHKTKELTIIGGRSWKVRTAAKQENANTSS